MRWRTELGILRSGGDDAVRCGFVGAVGAGLEADGCLLSDIRGRRKFNFKLKLSPSGSGPRPPTAPQRCPSQASSVPPPLFPSRCRAASTYICRSVFLATSLFQHLIHAILTAL